MYCVLLHIHSIFYSRARHFHGKYLCIRYCRHVRYRFKNNLFIVHLFYLKFKLYIRCCCRVYITYIKVITFRSVSLVIAVSADFCYKIAARFKNSRQKRIVHCCDRAILGCRDLISRQFFLCLIKIKLCNLCILIKLGNIA